MRTTRTPKLLAAVLVSGLVFSAARAHAIDPLPSWHDGKARQSILEFVAKVTIPGSPDFVPVSERIAVFDNDGTLWAEQPMYFQAFFILDRIKVLAPQHPEWNSTEPFASVLKGDVKIALAGGEHGLLELAMATHAGMTTDEFEQIVAEWIATARHPTTGRLLTEMVYQPMLELLTYLREQGFKTFIVSGGGIEFMRPWTERVYGIPPEQVIGSSIKTKFEMRDGEPVLARLPELNFIDDKAGKPVAINSHIGRRPIAAFGNSDGDLQMLQWTAGGTRPHFCLYVHHTDAEREWAYDRQSTIGRLDKGLDMAAAQGWTVVDIKDDWTAVYPSPKDPNPSPNDPVGKTPAAPLPSATKLGDHHYFAKQQHEPAVKWGYQGQDGPKYWGRLDESYRVADTGRRQSPINIDSANAVVEDLPRLIFDYQREQIRSHNNGHTIQHDGEPGSFVYVADQRFALEQFHVHVPSEHTIDGKQFDMELHFVHKSDAGQVAVVAVLVHAAPGGELQVPLYTLPNREGETVAYSGRRNPADFLPKRRDYFFYEGSFTTPPCTEGVKWVVMKQPLVASPERIARFREILQRNNRPIQPLNDRLLEQSR